MRSVGSRRSRTRGVCPRGEPTTPLGLVVVDDLLEARAQRLVEGRVLFHLLLVTSEALKPNTYLLLLTSEALTPNRYLV